MDKALGKALGNEGDHIEDRGLLIVEAEASPITCKVLVS